MPRILLPTNTLIGHRSISLVQQVIGARQDAQRLKESMDAIVGANLTLLETDVDAAVPVGEGSTVFNDMVAIKSALDALAPILSKYDRG